MSLVEPNARIAELAYLDVVELSLDGSFRVAESFVAECRAAYEADPSRFDEVFQDAIFSRAQARGLCMVDVDALALEALEIVCAAALG